MKLTNLPGRGTLFNFATILLGALIGIAIKDSLLRASDDVASTLMAGIGLFVIVLAVKVALSSRNFLIIAFAIALGGIIGSLLQIDKSIELWSIELKSKIGGDPNFAEGLRATSILFLVGPLTILGCLEDALERKITMLGTKSIMDGFSSIIFAAAYGTGVIATAFVVLVVQGVLTALAPLLKGVAKNEELLAELTGVGGVVLLATGLKLVGAIKTPAEVFLPSLLIAPLTVWLIQKLGRITALKKTPETQN